MSEERARLYVEGTDDKHVIIHLLARNGIILEEKSKDPRSPKLEDGKGVEKLLKDITDIVRNAPFSKIGFVFDADTDVEARWQQIELQLRKAGVEPFSYPCKDGFIGTSTLSETKVGVWVMPCNIQPGKLEDFLFSLIPDKDVLLPLAQSSTQNAKLNGAEFSEPDMDKAVIHTWLAWQKEPGLPYGTAINAQCFKNDICASEAFVDWFKKLYEL